MTPIDLINLRRLMDLSVGRPEIAVGLIDGPITTTHPDLKDATIREVPRVGHGTCGQDGMANAACLHGTFVAGILAAKRGSAAPAICPNCTLLVRPVFVEKTSGDL